MELLPIMYIRFMRAATIHEIKQELTTVKPAALLELCLRLGKFKKENKELLTYLLFEAQDEAGFIAGIKKEIETNFTEINQTNLYFAKKSLRKIARMINKYCRYSGIKETEIDLRLYFCRQLKDSGIPIPKNPVIRNLYDGQLKKIRELLAAMHEDVQYDYLKMLKTL